MLRRLGAGALLDFAGDGGHLELRRVRGEQLELSRPGRAKPDRLVDQLRAPLAQLAEDALPMRGMLRVVGNVLVEPDGASGREVGLVHQQREAGVARQLVIGVVACSERYPEL